MTDTSFAVTDVDKLAVTYAAYVLNENEWSLNIFNSDIFSVCHRLLTSKLSCSFSRYPVEVSVYPLSGQSKTIFVVR